MKIDKQKQGKRNRASGQRFEVKVYKDLENKGWICARWTKNVEFYDAPLQMNFKVIPNKIGKLVPAKSTRFRMGLTGY